MRHRFTTAMALSACLLGAAHAAEITRTNPTTLRLYGEIQPGDAAALAKLYTPQTTLLVVRTGGGNAEEGLKLGRFIHDHTLDLEVDTTCASSCANYLFPAARRKVIDPGAVLGFHGTLLLTAEGGAAEVRRQLQGSGIPPAQLDAQVADMTAYVARIATLERAYARDLKLDLRFYQDFKTVAEYSDTLAGKVEGADTPLWWPSAQRLAACYGITGVEDKARPAGLDITGYVYRADRKMLLIGDRQLPACTR